jgi:AraC-like DNA-binding protein
LKLQVAYTNLIQFLKSLVSSFESLAERKKISLKFKTDDDSFYGYIDRDKIEKIITNLLSNAFKFTPESGRIKVIVSLLGVPNFRDDVVIPKRIASLRTSARNDTNVQIAISNTGPGIPYNQIDKIFDRFYRTDDKYKKDSEGTGIGLALTKELVEACHGEISVSSIPDKTTTFVVNLPIAKECFKEDEIIEEEETADRIPETEEQISTQDEYYSFQSKSSKRSPVSRQRSPLLLIVEDNPDVTIEKYPDLIISDVMMPEMDGFELCKKIKTDKRISHIPVILLTAKADLDSKIEGLEFGADDYISKPFDSKELQVRARNLIEQRNKLREKFSQVIKINPAEITATSTDEHFIKRLLDVFENHIAESDFSTEKFANEVGMSRSSLHRKLQALTNQPTHEFLRTLRLKRAAQLLKKSAGNITEIAYSVGFNNPSYFSRIFKKQFGQTPADFAGKNKTTESSE